MSEELILNIRRYWGYLIRYPDGRPSNFGVKWTSSGSGLRRAW